MLLGRMRFENSLLSFNDTVVYFHLYSLTLQASKILKGDVMFNRFKFTWIIKIVKNNNNNNNKNIIMKKGKESKITSICK